MKQRLSGPLLTRLAEPISSDSITDSETRRVRVSFSSEQPVLRASFFDDPWMETLGHDETEADLSRMNDGAPVLHEHDRRRQIGVVERAWTENGRGYADIRLSNRDDVAGIWRDVQDGILSKTSVGYQIHERTLTRQGDPDEWRVTRWLPMELSLVSIPADASVGVGRGDDGPEHFTIRNIEDSQMSDDKTEVVETREAETTETRAAPPVDVDAIRAETARTERKRISQITDIGQRAQIAQTVISKAIDDGLSVDQFRSGPLVDALIERAGPEIRTASYEGGADHTDKKRAEATAWLLYRANEIVDGKPIDLTGNECRGMTLIDLARSSLERSGTRTVGMTREELVKRAITHSTDDFSTVLENTMHKALMNAFGAVPDTWRTFCGTGTLSDFRPHYRYRMGTFGDLLTVNEDGEFQNATIDDAERESITATTKGRIISVSRQMIINDDLGAFLGITRQMGRAAARAIEKDFYTLLAENTDAGPAMGDGNNLFDSSNHSNVGGTGGITPATLDNARQLLANQMDRSSNDYIGLLPYAILVPTGNYATMTQVLQSEGDPTSGNANSRKYNFARNMVALANVVSTPRVDTYWYMFADPAMDPAIEVGFLNGQQAPFLDREEGFRVDGVSFKVRYDYGIAAVHWRPVVRTAVTG